MRRSDVQSDAQTMPKAIPKGLQVAQLVAYSAAEQHSPLFAPLQTCSITPQQRLGTARLQPATAPCNRTLITLSLGLLQHHATALLQQHLSLGLRQHASTAHLVAQVGLEFKKTCHCVWKTFDLDIWGNGSRYPTYNMQERCLEKQNANTRGKRRGPSQIGGVHCRMQGV